MFVTKTEADYADSFRVVDGFYDDPDEVQILLPDAVIRSH